MSVREHLRLYGAVVLNGCSEGRVASVRVTSARASAFGANGNRSLYACKGPVHAYVTRVLRYATTAATAAAAVQDSVAPCADVSQDVVHRAGGNALSFLAQTLSLAGAAGGCVTGGRRRLL